MSQFLERLISTAHASPGRGWMRAAGPDGELHTRTWAQVHDDARRAAATLSARGVGPGSVVALFIGSPAEVAVAAQAVWLVGGSVTMLHQPTARTNLATYAADTFGVLRMIDADALVLGAPFDDLAGQFVESAGADAPAIFTAATLMAGSAQLDPDPHVVDDDAVALLQLTSGSTANPKAVRITHGSLIANMQAMYDTSAVVDDDVMVSWLPVFHDMGMVGFLTVPMTFGINLVKVTPADFVASPALWMRLISEHRGTITAAPNFAYALAARALARSEQLDLSSLRIALNGAEPIDPRAVTAFEQAGRKHGLDPRCVLCAYGMAESTLAVAFAPVGAGLQVDVIDQRALSTQGVAVPTDAGEHTSSFARLGPPLPGIEVEVRDDDGQPLPERRVGAIHIRGDAVTDGYLTVDGPVSAQDRHGWLDTGDEGYLVDGEVVVCGRTKDLIILAGRNIYPTDIERAAERAGGVRAGNTAAVPLARTGRETFAVIVESAHAGDAARERQIAQDVTLAVFDDLDVRPSRVVVVPSGTLPKTPSGKIQRARLAASIDSLGGASGAAAKP